MGLPAASLKSFDPGVCWVYPENWPAFLVFIGMQTQWRSGMNGPTGLVYASLPAVYQKNGIRRKQQQDVFAALQVVEAEVIKCWSEERQTN